MFRGNPIVQIVTDREPAIAEAIKGAALYLFHAPVELLKYLQRALPLRVFLNGDL